MGKLFISISLKKMKKTLFIIFVFLCSVNVAQGAEQQDTEPVEIHPLQIERRIIAEDAVPSVEKEMSLMEGIRDPFDVSAEKSMPSDYSLVAELVNLQGVVKMGNKQMGLFVVTKSRDEEVDFSKTVLRRVSIGERIRVYTKNVEYTFILQRLGSRSAVIVGENDEAYDIML